MNSSERFSKLKPKFKTLIVTVISIGFALSLVPTLYFTGILTIALDISTDIAVRGQENGTIWLILFLVIFILDILLFYALSCMAVGKANAWSLRKTIDIFWKSYYPEYWYKI